MAEMDGGGWKWLEIAKMAGNSWIWLEIARIAASGSNGFKLL